MATFRYKAFTAQNVITEGTIDAANMEAAIEGLYASGVTPFETRQSSARDGASTTGPRASNVSKTGSRSFGLKAIAGFTVELASLANAGLPLDEALRIIGGSGANVAMAALSKTLLKDVLAGAQLSEAMGRHPRIFPADYRAILGAGERSGTTSRVLGEVADLQNRRLEVRNKISAALVYPAILLTMSLVSVGVIVAVLVPNLTPIFSDAGLPLPGVLGGLVAMENDAGTLLIWLGAITALAVFAGRSLLANESTRASMDGLTLRLPVVGSFIKAREAGRFARALGALLGAGVSMMHALPIARGLVANRRLAQAYGVAIDRVPEGVSLSRALGDLALVPTSALRLVAVGEETGRVATMLTRAATILEAELQRRLDSWLGLMTPLMTLLIGGGVGGLIMSVMSAVLSINELAFK